ncbi:hypothetical protein PWT90_09660 [Aphanocladium album]|nr:hypothetical protein PWT90_09660 [Aphanocladium album]
MTDLLIERINAPPLPPASDIVDHSGASRNPTGDSKHAITATCMPSVSLSVEESQNRVSLSDQLSHLTLVEYSQQARMEPVALVSVAASSDAHNGDVQDALVMMTDAQPARLVARPELYNDQNPVPDSSAEADEDVPMSG